MKVTRDTTYLRNKAPAAWRSRQSGRRALVIATFCAVVLGLSASFSSAEQQGRTWVERPNAGRTPPLAQAVVGTGPLESIRGTIGRQGGVDMFKICAGPNFRATTVGRTTLDTQLFLFDRRGVGLYANDDASGTGTFQSTLPASSPNGPNIRSEYFLAISTFDRDPIDARVSRESKLIFPTFPFEQVFGRFTDTGPITGWRGFGFGTGDYTISVRGAAFLNARARCVPRSSSPASLEHIEKG